MPYPPTPTNIWDITQPPDTQLANLLGQDIRNLKQDIMQRMSLLSGTLANRPTPETVNATWGGVGFGILFFTTDTNQIFQWNGAAWVDVTFGIVPLPQRVAALDLVAQTVSIAPTVLYNVPGGKAGIYRIIANLVTTQAGTAGSVGFGVQWNNGSAAKDPGVLGTIGLLPVGSENALTNTLSFYVAGGTSIQYYTTVTGATGSPQYSFRPRLEYLG